MNQLRLCLIFKTEYDMIRISTFNILITKLLNNLLIIEKWCLKNHSDITKFRNI